MTEKTETQAQTKTLLSSVRDITQTLLLALVIWIVNTLYQVDKSVSNYSWRLERLENRLDSVDRRLSQVKETVEK